MSLAAALAAEATALCTSNTKDFPASVVEAFGINVVTPDPAAQSACTEYEPQMLAAPGATVTSLNGATDESTISALRRAGAPRTAALMATLLGIKLP